jgi:serine protease Do
MRVPDWLIYSLALFAVVFALMSRGEDSDAPEVPPPPLPPITAPPKPPPLQNQKPPVPGEEVPGALPPVVEEKPSDGILLPGPSEMDPRIMVEVGPVQSGIGTAFAIDDRGWWITARHVVDSCQRVGLVVSGNSAAPVQDVKVSTFADLALLRTPGAPDALRLDPTEDDFVLAQKGFHVGFPQGNPGEATSRLLGRHKLVARGRYDLDEPVLAWAEVGRTRGLVGTLSGMSGGPVFDENGRVIGVTVAESARRGRLYTASPSSIVQLLNEANVNPDGADAGRFTVENYGPMADRLRRDLAVAKVICVANDEG